MGIQPLSGCPSQKCEAISYSITFRPYSVRPKKHFTDDTMDLICAGLIAVITAVLVVVLPKYFKKPLPVIWSGYTAPGWEKVRQVYK